MPLRTSLPVILFTLLILVPADSGAIVVRPAVSAGMGSAVVEGDVLTSDAGPTFGGELLFGVSPSIYVGASFDYSTFGIDEFEDDLKQIDVDASARYFFPAGAIQLFAGGSAGYSRQSFELPPASVTQDLGTGGGGGTSSADGFNLGGTLGAAIDVGPVAIEISASAQFNKFGDLENPDADQAEPSATSGMRFLGRIGIAVPLGTP